MRFVAETYLSGPDKARRTSTITTKVVRFLILASACVGAEHLLFCDDPFLLTFISGRQIYTTSNSKTFIVGESKKKILFLSITVLLRAPSAS